MNKKYAIGALVVVCAGVAGWFGMRAVETRTEESVAEALASVPAKAREIRYSFLENTLTLNGVEYEFADAGLERRGSIESVEVKGFNRKYVFTRSDEPYNPDALPVVAESIAAEGIADRMTFGRTSVVEQKVEKVQLTGWYQRLGTLLSQRKEHMGEASFFEELYRCRIDGMEASGISMKLSDADMAPVNVNVGKIALIEGLRAPREGEKVSPVSLGFFGLRFSGRDFSGGLDTLELRDILVPEPEILAEFIRAGKRLDAVEEEDWFDAVGEKFVTDLELIVRKAYEDKMPVGRIFMEGGTFTVQDTPAGEGEKPSVFSMTMKSLDYRLSVPEKGACRYVTDLSGLKMTFPDTMEEYDILSRYAPEGLTLNATSDSLLGRDAFSGKARYELEGLGVLEGDMAFLGDIRGVLDAAVYGGAPSDLDALMNNLRIKGMNVVYRDSGLVPMSVEIAARWDDSTVENVLTDISGLLQKMTQEKERPVREFGSAMLVMCDQPGEFTMTVAPERPMNFTEAVMLASLNPDKLPITFSAKPGTKPLRDYLPQK